MISKTESQQDDTERKEPEERKEEVEPDSRLAWKPVQPKDVDTSTMPPPPKPLVGRTTKDFQLMPPPSLPAGLMAKGTFIFSRVFHSYACVLCCVCVCVCGCGCIHVCACMYVCTWYVCARALHSLQEDIVSFIELGHTIHTMCSGMWCTTAMPTCSC